MLSLAVVLAAAAEPVAAKPMWVPLNQSQTRAVQKPEVEQPQQPAAPPPVIEPEPEAGTPVAPVTQAQVTPVTDGSRPLQLTCLGGGTANKATSAVAWGWGGWGVVSGHKDRGFNEQVDIRLFTGDDRIRMPRTMLPGIHGGSAGWFKLHDVVADARSIRASAGVAMLNNPKIFIDRVTGTISISGKAGDYAGQCQVIDANAAPKF
jgi:hypothetical protein